LRRDQCGARQCRADHGDEQPPTDPFHDAHLAGVTDERNELSIDG
jgi:hypothetical protein